MFPYKKPQENWEKDKKDQKIAISTVISSARPARNQCGKNISKH